MKNKLCLLFLMVIFLFGKSFAQEWAWAKKAGNYAFDYGYGICADDKGNVYVSGKYEMDAYFDENTTVSCDGNHDIFTAKYDQYGNLLWVRTAGGLWGDYAHAVTCDGNGNVYVTGELETTIQFHGSTTTLSTWGGNDMFIAKYNTEGELLWAKRGGGGGKGGDRGYAIDLHTDAVYVAGSFNDTAYFDNHQVTSAGDHDTYIAKYDLNGSLLWIKRGGGIGEDRAIGVAVDSNGDVYTIGHFDNQVEFNGVTYNGKGGRDLFIAKYDSNGNLVWFKPAGSDRSDMGTSIAVGKDGRIYLTGSFRGESYFENVQITSRSSSDIFVACYTKDGEAVWVKRSGGDFSDRGVGITIDDSVNVYVTGYFGLEGDFGNTSITAADSADIFVSKYDKDGNFKWVMQVGGQADSELKQGTEESGRSLWMDKSGNLLLTGSMRNNGVFGNTNLIGWMHTDIFLAKIKQSFSKDFTTPTSLTDFNSFSALFDIFPNPAEGSVNVSYDGNEQMNISIKVQSIEGKTIIERNYLATGQSKEILDLRYFKSGVYIVSITTGEQRVIKKLVVK